MHWTWCINRFCEAPGSIGHTSALAKLWDWPGKHSLLTNSFALTVSIESTAFKMGRNVMQAHVKEKKTALLHPTVPGKQSYCQHLCNGQEYATKAGKQGHVKACLGKALEMKQLLFLATFTWDQVGGKTEVPSNRNMKSTTQPEMEPAANQGHSECYSCWNVPGMPRVQLQSTRETPSGWPKLPLYLQQHLPIEQPGAQHLPTHWESKTSSETEKGCAQISAVVNHQNRRRSTRKKNARSRSFSSRSPLQGLNWKRHRWMQRRPGVHEDRIPGEMIQEMEPVLTRFWPGLIGQTPKIFVSNNASLSFGSSFTLDDYEHLTFSAKTCQDCQFGED